MTIFTSHDYSAIFGLVSTALALACLVIGLDSIWRVEKKLETFMVILTCAITPLLFKDVLQIFGYQNSHLVAFYYLLDAVGMFLLLVAFIEFFEIVRGLDNENPSYSKPKDLSQKNDQDQKNN